jgi:hypothetical protein
MTYVDNIQLNASAAAWSVPSDLEGQQIFGNFTAAFSSNASPVGPAAGALFSDVTNLTQSAYNTKNSHAGKEGDLLGHDATSFMHDLASPSTVNDVLEASVSSAQSRFAALGGLSEEVNENSATARLNEDLGSFWTAPIEARPPMLQTPQKAAGQYAQLFTSSEMTPSAIVQDIVQLALDTPAKAPQEAEPLPAMPEQPTALAPMTVQAGPELEAPQAEMPAMKLPHQQVIKSPSLEIPRPTALPFMPDTTIVLEFKMGRKLSFKCHNLTAIAISDWVVVELTQGGMTDLACCCGIYHPSEYEQIPKSLRQRAGVALRLADADDCHVLNEVIPDMEAKALSKAHQLIHFLHMPFSCIDAEFQFDLKLVIVYYALAPQAFTAGTPNPIRLQRELSFMLKSKVRLELLVPVDQPMPAVVQLLANVPVQQPGLPQPKTFVELPTVSGQPMLQATGSVAVSQRPLRPRQW